MSKRSEFIAAEDRGYITYEDFPVAIGARDGRVISTSGMNSFCFYVTIDKTKFAGSAKIILIQLIHMVKSSSNSKLKTYCIRRICRACRTDTGRGTRCRGDARSCRRTGRGCCRKLTAGSDPPSSCKIIILS